jgi:hypothetical protein
VLPTFIGKQNQLCTYVALLQGIAFSSNEMNVHRSFVCCSYSYLCRLHNLCRNLKHRRQQRGKNDLTLMPGANPTIVGYNNASDVQKLAALRLA